MSRYRPPPAPVKVICTDRAELEPGDPVTATSATRIGIVAKIRRPHRIVATLDA